MTSRPAGRVLGADRDDAVRWALGMLAEAIGGPCPEPVAMAVTSWATDPYSGGAYTHIPPGASPADADLLGDPVGGRLLSAGEHTQSARLAYADGAMTSGIREAKRLLSQSSVHFGPAAADQGLGEACAAPAWRRPSPRYCPLGVRVSGRAPGGLIAVGSQRPRPAGQHGRDQGAHRRALASSRVSQQDQVDRAEFGQPVPGAEGSELDRVVVATALARRRRAKASAAHVRPTNSGPALRADLQLAERATGKLESGLGVRLRCSARVLARHTRRLATAADVGDDRADR